MKHTFVILLLAAVVGNSAAQQVDQGLPAYDFTLLDTANQPVRLADFVGKTVIVDIWHSSCASCIYFYQEKLKPTLDSISGREDVVFLSISLDDDFGTWIGCVEAGKFTSHTATNAYAGAPGIKHPIRDYHGISAVPHVHIIDKNGRIADMIRDAYRYSKEELALRIKACL